MDPLQLTDKGKTHPHGKRSNRGYFSLSYAASTTKIPETKFAHGRWQVIKEKSGLREGQKKKKVACGAAEALGLRLKQRGFRRGGVTGLRPAPRPSAIPSRALLNPSHGLCSAFIFSTVGVYWKKNAPAASSIDRLAALA
jgi:hypothetical protein